MASRSWWQDHGKYPYILARLVLWIGLIALVLYTLKTLQVVVIPILLSGILAYIGHGLVDRMEGWKIPRSVGAGLMMLFYVGLLTLFAFLFVPYFIGQMTALANKLPEMIAKAIQKTTPFVKEHFGLTLAVDPASVVDLVKTHLKDMVEPTRWVVSHIFASALSFALAVFNMVIMIVFTYYMMRDYNRIIKEIGDLIPRRYYKQAVMVGKTIDEVVTGFIHGQITVSIILAGVYAVALALTGLEMGATIGLIAGICNFIPYMATVVGVSLSSLAILLNYSGWGQVLAVGIIFAVVPLLDAAFITPHVVGSKVGLNPFIVIVALLIGAPLLGILGVLLAIPSAAVIKAMLVMGIDAYKKGSYYQATGD